MDYSAIFEILNKYGLIVIFALLFAEYLNLPGFPATPILLAVGAWAQYEGVLVQAFLISIIGAQCGTVLLYWIGRGFGHLIMERYYRKFPKHQERIERYVERIDNEGPHILIIIRLIPLFRTLITIPSGMLQIDFKHFFWYSLIGIIIWNAVFIFLGSGAYEIYASMIF